MSGGKGSEKGPRRARLRAGIKRLAAPRVLLAACYLAAAVFWLLQALVCLAIDRALPERVLGAAEAARLEQLEPAGGQAYRTVGPDPQMVFETGGLAGRMVLLRAVIDGEPGEMELFYNRRPGQAFTAGRGFIGIPQPGGGKKPLVTLFGRRAIGRPVQQGWLYTLPAGAIQELRVDFGMRAGLTAEAVQVVVNPRLPLSYYLLPTPRGLLALALAPALACCVFLTIMDIGRRPAKGSKKAARRDDGPDG